MIFLQVQLYNTNNLETHENLNKILRSRNMQDAGGFMFCHFIMTFW